VRQQLAALAHDSMKNSTYKRCSQTVIDGKEINRDHARRLRAQELAPRRARSLPRRPELLLVGELKGLGVERKSSAVVS
jgi:hypothetical protein